MLFAFDEAKALVDLEGLSPSGYQYCLLLSLLLPQVGKTSI
jgi:hypothetical protein